MLSITDSGITGHFVTRWDDADSARRGFPGIPWGYEPLLPQEFREAVDADFPFLAGIEWGQLARTMA